MIIKMNDIKPVSYESDWMGIDWQRNSPFFEITDDSLVMNTVRVDVVRSPDSSWHLRKEKLSRGNNVAAARSLASQINFDVDQRDSLLYLAPGFSIRSGQQFRNQQVMLVVEMPVGKKIRMDESLQDYHWFDFNRNWRNHGVEFDWDDNSDNSSNGLESNVDYTMTEHGLERSSGKKVQDKSDSDDDDQPENKDDHDKHPDAPKDGYRYHKDEEKNKQKEIKKTTRIVPGESARDAEGISPLVLLTQWS
jgi:hypothetical protein